MSVHTKKRVRRGRNDWAVSEIEVVQQLYPTESAQTLREKYRLDRSDAAIRNMAQRLGIRKFVRGEEITETESQEIAAMWRSPGAVQVIAGKINRTVEQTRAAGIYRGLHREADDAWSDSDLAKLAALWPELGTKCASEFAGRTPTAVSVAARKLRLRKKHERGSGLNTLPWTAAELDLLKQPVTSSALLAALPHRTRVAIKNRRQKLRQQEQDN